MRYSVDTHTMLWYANDDPRLSKPARAILENPDSSLCFSIACVWEMAIKVSIGKLNFNLPLDAWIKTHLSKIEVELIPISLFHVWEVAKLPYHHRDPFDRMLVAQCLVEKIPIVSVDPLFDQYGVQRIW